MESSNRIVFELSLAELCVAMKYDFVRKSDTALVFGAVYGPTQVAIDPEG
jgi:hypothetical protein